MFPQVGWYFVVYMVLRESGNDLRGPIKFTLIPATGLYLNLHIIRMSTHCSSEIRLVKIQKDPGSQRPLPRAFSFFRLG